MGYRIPKRPQVHKAHNDGSQLTYIIVLRMLSCFVGEDKFLKGVFLYLKDKLYGNSTTADLWRGVEQATGWRVSPKFPHVNADAGIKVSEFMEAWISKVSGRNLCCGAYIRWC
jgi:hypothetical protein